MVGGTIQVKCQKQAQSYKDKQNSIDLKQFSACKHAFILSKLQVDGKILSFFK